MSTTGTRQPMTREPITLRRALELNGKPIPVATPNGPEYIVGLSIQGGVLVRVTTAPTSDDLDDRLTDWNPNDIRETTACAGCGEPEEN